MAKNEAADKEYGDVLTVDFNIDDVPDSYEIPAGLYKVSIGEAKAISNPGKCPFLEVVMNIASGDFKGSQITDRIMLRNDLKIGQIRLKRLIKYANVQYKCDSENKISKFRPGRLVGCVVAVETYNEDFNGISIAKVKDYHPESTVGVSKPSEDTVSETNKEVDLSSMVEQEL